MDYSKIILLLLLLKIFFAIMIIVNKNPVHSMLFLILVFILSTIVLLLLNVQFIAMLFIVVYVGAVSILFLFVIMMLNIKIIELNELFIKYIPIAMIIGFIFLLEILFLINQNILSINWFSKLTNVLYIIENNDTLFDLSWFNYFKSITSLNNTELLSISIYTDYVYLFIIASLILLVAMVGVIILTLSNSKETKTIEIYDQVNNDINSILRFIK